MIASKELPVGEPEGVNTQAHSEQPKPRKRFSSIHTSLRGICLLASVCDTSHHSSSKECFGGGDRQGEEPTNSTLTVQFCCQQTSAGISSLGGNRVGSHRSSCARDVLRYIVTFVMLVRGGCWGSPAVFPKWTLRRPAALCHRRYQDGSFSLRQHLLQCQRAGAHAPECGLRQYCASLPEPRERFERYTRVTTPNLNFPTNQIIHLRLLRKRPFWAGG
jgi:hypothetical protein